MTIPITGGCGALRYECPVEPVASVTCSCTDCKVFYGGVMSAALVLPRDAVEITGAVTYYRVEGSSGRPVDRSFCPTCGTQVFGKPGIAPQLMSVTAGTWDDPAASAPR